MQRWTPYAAVVVILAATLAAGWLAAAIGVATGALSAESVTAQTAAGGAYTLSGAVAVLLGIGARHQWGGGDDR